MDHLLVAQYVRVLSVILEECTGAMGMFLNGANVPTLLMNPNELDRSGKFLREQTIISLNRYVMKGDVIDQI